MGTNFYFLTKDKEIAQKIAPNSYELTDSPVFAYEIHIAKTSCGWLPLFQGYVDGISSVEDIKKIYETGKVEIFDEYNQEYTWFDFEERVLKFNGGITGVIKKQKYEINPNCPFYDKDMPDYLPVSHFDYGHGKYSHMYYKDKEGYEFTLSSFT